MAENTKETGDTGFQERRHWIVQDTLSQAPTLLRSAGAFLVVENTFATDSMKQRKGRTAPLTMIDCFYFVATTISTVGSALRGPTHGPTGVSGGLPPQPPPPPTSPFPRGAARLLGCAPLRP